ncbi:MAG: hypothetical protein Q9191_003955, partial [Dirinaria sp. TL-2023a]
LLLGLVVTAAVSLQQITSLSVPIARSTPIATLLLPILTGLSLRGAQALARRSHGAFLTKEGSFTWSTVSVFVILTIYDTVIVTLAITHLGPESWLKCALDEQWQRLYSGKNGDAIRRIQDRHRCCGLHSVRDRPYPLPIRGRGDEACVEMYEGRGHRSCFKRWRKDEQISAGLLVFVAVMTFLVKVVVILLFRARPSWSSPNDRYTTPAHLANNKARGSGRGKNRRIEAQYRDEPETDDEDSGKPKAITANDGEVNNNEPGDRLLPVVQPSRLQENGERNEWT